MPFELEELSIPGLKLLKPRVFEDHRGYFKELFKASAFSSFGISESFVQDNLSFSRRGVLRGLHYQRDPFAQGKLVSCLQGRIFDVAVDIRPHSPYFGKWIALEISEENHYLLYIPPGFAHGFQVLSEKALVWYKCTSEYAPDYEGGIIWNDPDLNINWPLENPILSPRDASWPSFKESLRDANPD